MAGRTTVLVSDATGFVGGHLYHALIATGREVRCGTRDPESAREHDPVPDWVAFDIQDPDSMRLAMNGCDAAYLLLPDVGNDDDDRAIVAATNFRSAAEQAGITRIVYLGGVEPKGEPPRRLRARIEIGELLRAGNVPVVELRAALIIGEGSIGWKVVRDVAARLPALSLPSWMENRSAPVFIDDVVTALLASILDARIEAKWYDLTGPRLVSHRELIEKTAAQMDLDPVVVESAEGDPESAAFWVALISDADPELTRELVESLQADLTPSGETVWHRLDDVERVHIDAAIAMALADGRDPGNPCEERRKALVAIGKRYAQ
ncbi:MAG: NAD(P)H-binding protein [Acidobacteria bacterium]|nr:NAD(P)H-binding protein [Acidobacteriota bacterium]